MVDRAQTGLEADLQVRLYDYDVLILEDRFPGGSERIQRWRGQGLQVPILVVTSSPQEQDRIGYLNEGADDCVPASLAPAELVARIKALGRRGLPKRLRIRDLEIDRTQRRVYRAGKDIALTPREFDLLELLAQHPGQVVSRAAIRQALFSNLHNYSNVVEVYISTLRHKIDKDFRPPLIQTRRGEGYFLGG